MAEIAPEMKSGLSEEALGLMRQVWGSRGKPKAAMTAAALAKASGLEAGRVEALLGSLAEAGLVQVTRAARAVKVAALPAAEPFVRASPKPASSTGRARKPAQAEALAELLARVARIEEKLDRALAGTRSEPSAERPAAPVKLDEAILEALGALERERFSSGVVPLPPLRERLGAGAGSRESIDARLLALETEGRVQLSAANDPARIDRSQAIDAGRRGLLYYAIRSDGGR